MKELKGVLTSKSGELDAEKNKVMGLEEKLHSPEKALEEEVKNTSLLCLDIEKLQKVCKKL